MRDCDVCRSVSFLCGRVGTDAADSARECSRGAIGARQLAVLKKKMVDEQSV